MVQKTKHSAWAGMLAAAVFSAATPAGPVLAQTNAPEAQAGYCSSSVAPYRGSEFLAYIKTNPAVDAVAESGLKALATRLSEKTSLEEATKNKTIEVVGIDIETQDLCHFHFIYMPIDADTAPLSSEAQRKLEDYLRHGGFILPDIRDISADWDEALRAHLGNVNLGILKPVNEVSSVCETFYKNVQNFPGSFNLSPVYAQVPLRKTGDPVSQVIVGQRRWADAWAGLTQAPAARGMSRLCGVV
ncbi:MAG: DUF4159 domain-containing protein [Alphaproteobacteria bacterium]|nr:DUF4159 domain-containing protein [Alphaproteobacteria bacterium]